MEATSVRVKRNARLVADMIVQMAGQIAPSFERALTKASKVSVNEVLSQIKLELCALYIHLWDRDASARLGQEDRALFMDELLVEVVVRLQPELGAQNLEPFYNEFVNFCHGRESEYSAYEDLVPPPGASLGGTLFWEFGKKMGLTYQGYNPVAVQLFSLAACDGYIAISEAIHAQEQAQPNAQVKSLHCNSCGAQIPIDAGFCQQCGKAIALSQQNSVMDEATYNASKTMIAYLTALARLNSADRKMLSDLRDKVAAYEKAHQLR